MGNDIEVFRDLPSEARDRLESVIHRFETAWQQSPPPELDAFLPALPSERRLVLVELIHADLEFRLKAGEAVRLESYLSRYPELAEDDEAVLDLLVAEYAQRRHGEPHVDIKEYLQRFPRLADKLAARLGKPGGNTSLDDSEGIVSQACASDSTTITADERSQDGPRPRRRRAMEWPSIHGYEILEEVGSGGMGIVYKARQLRPHRIVALKIIARTATPNSEVLVRFLNEAESVARLQHPNIVQVHEVGHQDGWPYFTMEFVEGGNLSQRVAHNLPQPAEAAQLVEALARAIHTAHQSGIVHRDLKPANVLLAPSLPSHTQYTPGSTPLGTPKITDFGLAKRLGEGQGLTQTGLVLGTPPYMAPEQAAGTRHVGPAADVYSLGGILYELLTGQPPFHGKTREETLHLVQTQEPVPPRLLRRQVPFDLETICLKCLEKDPRLRYATAEALAEDLHAFVNGEPIKAHPPRPLQRLLRYLQRRPLLAAGCGVCSVATLGLVLGYLGTNHPLAVGAVAVVGLLVGNWWYSARLQAALRDAYQGHVRAERQLERLYLLLDMTRRLMGVTDLDLLLHVLSDMAARLTKAERATVYLLDPERQELWSKVSLSEDGQNIRLPIGKGLAGVVALTGEGIHTPDAYVDPRFNPDVDRRTGYRTRNLLTLPLKGRNGLILGVFQVLNKRGGDFDQEDMRLLSALAASAAIALELRQDKVQASSPDRLA